MCYWLFPDLVWTSFFSYKGELLNKDLNNIIHRKDQIDENLLSLLVGMLDLRSDFRFSVTEALNHEYFTGEIIQSNYIEHGLNIVAKNYKISKKVDMDHLETMFQNYKSCSVKINTNLPENYRTLFKNNTLNGSYNYIFLELEKIKTANKTSSSILSLPFFEMTDVNDFPRNILQETLNQLVNTKIEMKPVTIFFFYIILKYRVEKIGDVYSFKFLNDSFSNFVKKVDFDFNIWNVISVIFWNATNSDPEIGNLDISNPERIIALIS